MYGAPREADGSRGVSSVSESLVNRRLDVSYIVERVEYSDYINAVFNALFDKKTHHIVGIVLVTEKILASQKHLELRIGAGFPDFAEPFPGIFVEIAEAGVKSGAAPAFQGIVTGLVKSLENGLKSRERHSCKND